MNIWRQRDLVYSYRSYWCNIWDTQTTTRIRVIDNWPELTTFSSVCGCWYKIFDRHHFICQTKSVTRVSNMREDHERLNSSTQFMTDVINILWHPLDDIFTRMFFPMRMMQDPDWSQKHKFKSQTTEVISEWVANDLNSVKEDDFPWLQQSSLSVSPGLVFLHNNFDTRLTTVADLNTFVSGRFLPS